MAAATSLSDEADASILKFGDAFDRADCMPLMISEVQLILEARKLVEQGDDATEKDAISSFQKTLDYTTRFGQFKNKESLKAIRKLLEPSQARDDADDTQIILHKFEQAALANLCPETAEEAKALIPSLQERNVDDFTLNELLQEMQAFRSLAHEDL